MELLSAMTGTREYEEYIDRIDIPEGGISMCTVLESALQEGRELGLEQGQLQAIRFMIKLIKLNRISVSEAAQGMDMTVEEFESEHLGDLFRCVQRFLIRSQKDYN